MGYIYSALRQSIFPPKSKFSVDDIPDLTGKIIVVTGGNTGIGKEAIKALLSHNAKVYILTRNREKTEAAIAELKELTGHEAHFITCDLADLKSVKAGAADFLSKEQELHVLMNNAGVAMPPMDQLTVQGYDAQFGTNALGHFYLTKLLLPILLSTSKNSGEKVRIVTVSSLGHLFHPLDFESFTDTPARRKYSLLDLYGQSKFASIVFALELAKRYGNQGIVSTSLHPGMIKSELTRHMSSLTSWFSNFIVFATETGALTQLYAATSPEAETLNGKYLIPWARVGEPDKNTQDANIGKQFWEWCEEQVKDI
ncbi:hypothetical protein M378DRAFT_79922 [Amanita muscaria Koide BX008]|uniref:NAD(P)-binding protein n=1 Tax=Amanita muscaria (strain Koide BX008) TaxID=946122 RepID=A0A0C2WNR9_AMAMK|nr:hypothetical protein M378DRAFT_79922 [Amanita muscaria Koide BX008]